MDPDQTAPIGAVCSGATLFATILNSPVMLGNYLQQTTSADAFFLGALRVSLTDASILVITYFRLIIITLSVTFLFS